MKLSIYAGLLLMIVLVGARPQFRGESDFNIPFQNMLGNSQTQTQVYRIAFRPDDALKNRVRFEEKHGRFGERLIASFGAGLSPAAAQALTADDQVVNRNNWTLRDKKRHQNYFTAISYETSATPSSSTVASRSVENNTP